MSRLVLDASALLAILNEEPGSGQWADAVAEGVMSAVNLSEVIARLTELGLLEADVQAMIGPLDLEIAAFDENDAWLAGVLRGTTRAAGLSFGDRACLALGRRLKLPVLTADRAWKSVRAGVQVRLIRASG